MRELSCNAPTRALDGTFAVKLKQSPCVTRTLCGGGPGEERGTGTASLPSSRLRSPADETGCIGGSGSTGAGSLQSGLADGRGGHGRRRPVQTWGFDIDGNIIALGWGHHSMPFPWKTCSNVSRPGRKCSRTWLVHARV